MTFLTLLDLLHKDPMCALKLFAFPPLQYEGTRDQFVACTDTKWT